MAWAIGILAAGALTLVVILAMYVEDWSRDLTTNYARTSNDADDELLRPLLLPLTVADAAERVKAAATSLSGWNLADESDTEGTPQKTLHFVRTTSILRFHDDVIVTITGEGDDSLIEMESQSRVGRGDLGQNPRNISELHRAILKRGEE